MTGPPPITNRPWLRRLGLTVAVLLLLAAVFVVVQQRAVVLDALAAVSPPSPLPLLVLLCAVAINLLLSGLMFSLLMSRYGKVGLMEMQALIAATTLVNYLPLRPGMFGRIAYHKAVNQIAVADSARTIVQGVILSISVAAYAALAAVLSIQLKVPMYLTLLAPVGALGLAGFSPLVRIWCWAALVRYLELLVWAVRYAAAFALLGLEVHPESALAMACVGVVATMVPFVSNGLGLREWAIGLVAPLLTAHQLSLGITAELLNRAAELLVVTCLGLLSMAYLTQRRRAAGAKA